MREYGIDLLDFYRGKISTRRLDVLIRHLSADSSVSRAMNDGQPPLTRTEHFLADLWAVFKGKDHPVRAAIVAKARNAKKLEKHKRMQAKYGVTTNGR